MPTKFLQRTSFEEMSMKVNYQVRVRNYISLIRPFQGPSSSTVNPSPNPTASQWCVPKAGVSDAQLQANLDYACSHSIDCGPIQPGGACFEPNTVASHAAYAMNLYYQTYGKNPWNCDFSQTATVTSANPSKLFFWQSFLA